MKEILKIGLDSAAPFPMHTDFHSDLFEGFEVDLMQHIADHLNLELQYETSLWKNILERLYKGQLDMICSAVTMTTSRQRILEFSIPYLQFRLCAVVNRENSFHTMGSLDHKIIGIRTATEAEKYIMEKFPSHEVVHADRNVDLYKMLLNKQIDVLIDDSPIAGAFIKKYPGLEIGMFLPNTHSQYGIAMKKGDTPLRLRINDTLIMLKENGVYHKLYKKWFSQIEL